MVTFTCGGCNSTLKKNKVDNHYRFQCRKGIQLTCIDCLKDFGEDYTGHTSCVTENQRYGGQNYVEKPQAVKQNEWLSICQKVLERKDLTDKQRKLLDLCSSHTNVPRNKKRFSNFIFNVGREFRKNSVLIDEVFDILEGELKKHKENGSKLENGNSSQGEKRKRADSTSDCGLSSVNDLLPEQKKKRNKIVEQEIIHDAKSKFKEALQSLLPDNNEDGKNAESYSKHYSDKEDEDTDILSKKEKRKRKKEAKYKAEVEEINTAPKNCEDELSNKAQAESRKKKKKVAEEPQIEETSVPDHDEEPSVLKATGKFDWSATIVRVLQASKDKEMSLKKLSKKVLAEYQFQKGAKAFEPIEKISAKFNKKVTRTVGVKVLKDRAILTEDK